MPGTGGYLTWDALPYRGVLTFGTSSLTFLADFGYGGMKWDLAAESAIITTHARTRIWQSRVYGGNVPLSIGEVTCSFSALMESEADYRILMRAKSYNRPVQVYFGGDQATDVWYVPAQNSGVYTYKTTFPIAYNGTTVTVATNPASADIDGTALNIVTSAPASGDLQVPSSASGGTVDTVTSHSSLSGSYLTLHYPARPFCRINSVGRVLETVNGLSCSVSLTALPMGGSGYTVQA